MGGPRLIPGSPQDGPLREVDLAGVAAAFGLRLRQRGLPVTPEMEGRFAQAIETTAPRSLRELELIGRVTLTSGRDQADLFQRVFRQVFGGLEDRAEARGDPTAPQLPVPAGRRRAGSAPGPTPKGRPELRPAQQRGEDTDELQLGQLGAAERLGKKDFSECSAEELAEILELIRRLPLNVPRRRSRRRRAGGGGGRLDLRATLRRAHRTGADPVDLVLRRQVLKPRRLVMLADVSGSMEPYTRAYLNLFYGAVRSTRAECFVFATRLTRLTAELAGSDPDRALQRAGARAPDWSGGTLIGRALQDFNDRFGRRGMARGAIVVIVSDGWEGGDPAQLGRQMRSLHLLANRVVWVNPRSARASFVPQTAGMAAALPHVDTMVSGHSLEAMRVLLAAIRAEPADWAAGPRSPVAG